MSARGIQPTVPSASTDVNSPPKPRDPGPGLVSLRVPAERGSRAQAAIEPLAAGTTITKGRSQPTGDRISGSRRAANARNRAYAIIRKSGARSPQSRINRAIAPLIIISGVATMFDGGHPHEWYQGIATIPEALWELSLGIYALIWGFRRVPIVDEYDRDRGMPVRATPEPVPV